MLNIEIDLAIVFKAIVSSKKFDDDKICADLFLKKNPKEIISSFNLEKDKAGFDIKGFIDENFEWIESKPTTEANSSENSPIIEHIEKLWDELERSPDNNKKVSTRINLPFPYIVPGGRFNEIYYWDSYFTMLGLAHFGKWNVIEYMIENFAWMIDKFGFIPNGNRSYFLSRSQPPFFSLMIELLAKNKGTEIYKKYLPHLEKEYDFWTKEYEPDVTKSIKLGDDILQRYCDQQNSPRVEMYSTDLELEGNLKINSNFYREIRSACESGWDFSARWFRNPNDLKTIHTTEILPVDLNCLLYKLEKIIAKANLICGKKELSDNFEKLAKNRAECINKYFWNEEKGYYFDYDWKEMKTKEVYSLAGAFPLLFEIASPKQAEKCSKNISDIFLQKGGVVSTPLSTGQQWDSPNGWAPLQYTTVTALENYGYTDLANEIKSRWIDLNKKVYANTGKMMEKYNVINMNLENGGGEYPVQDGFGWTNGIFSIWT